MTRMDEFPATLYKIGMNYCVDVPTDVTSSWKDRHVPVRLVVEGLVGFTTALRRKDGGYRVFVNVSIRELAGLAEGSEVAVRLEPTSELSEPDVPEDLERALSLSKTDQNAWDALTLRQRRDFVRYLNEAKGADTRKRRLTHGLETIRSKGHR
jgi:hypothetical protein